MERIFQAQPITLLLNIAVPAVLGVLVGILMKILGGILRGKGK
jgi:hypothetical protein